MDRPSLPVPFLISNTHKDNTLDRGMTINSYLKENSFEFWMIFKKIFWIYYRQIYLKIKKIYEKEESKKVRK